MSNKKHKREPLLLANVLQAVADLREVNGSTSKKILEVVQSSCSKNKIKPSAFCMQVKRAIKHALQAGVLMQRSGRFKLAIGPESCARSLVSLKKGSKTSNRRGRKGSEDYYEEEPSQSGQESGGTSYAPSEATTKPSMPSEYEYNEEPQDRSNRRSRRSKRCKKRCGGSKRRKRREDNDPEEDGQNTEDNDDKKAEDCDRPLKPKRSRKHYHQNAEYDNAGESSENMSMNNDCDNPNCLCGMKQNIEDLEQYNDIEGQDDYLN